MIIVILQITTVLFCWFTSVNDHALKVGAAFTKLIMGYPPPALPDGVLEVGSGSPTS